MFIIQFFHSKNDNATIVLAYAEYVSHISLGSPPFALFTSRLLSSLYESNCDISKKFANIYHLNPVKLFLLLPKILFQYAFAQYKLKYNYISRSNTLFVSIDLQ